MSFFGELCPRCKASNDQDGQIPVLCEQCEPPRLEQPPMFEQARKAQERHLARLDRLTAVIDEAIDAAAALAQSLRDSRAHNAQTDTAAILRELRGYRRDLMQLKPKVDTIVGGGEGSGSSFGLTGNSSASN